MMRYFLRFFGPFVALLSFILNYILETQTKKHMTLTRLIALKNRAMFDRYEPWISLGLLILTLLTLLLLVLLMKKTKFHLTGFSALILDLILIAHLIVRRENLFFWTRAFVLTLSLLILFFAMMIITAVLPHLHKSPDDTVSPTSL